MQARLAVSSNLRRTHLSGRLRQGLGRVRSSTYPPARGLGILDAAAYASSKAAIRHHRKIVARSCAQQGCRIPRNARSHNVPAHRRAVRGLVVGALLAAGFFTFAFDRLLGHWLFAPM
jgi:hypothetical protein